MKLRRIRAEEETVLRQLMQYYFYDFSAYNDADVLPDGRYGEYPNLERYWEPDSGHHPYFIEANNGLAGFALVSVEDNKGTPRYVMSEFFVMRKYRSQGIGSAAACSLFDAYPGRWIVTQIKRNAPARAFWRKVIADYTGNQYTEHEEPNKIVQSFTASHPSITEGADSSDCT
ncbi:GNAT family N-acetyltransferase [Paenibacillus dendritiformis]|uniref:GNAT family N-acetyltransferase n=1 Tax=Paenibacillus dendritiformis TaxID=130049 RepID=UPI0015EBF8AF|nr:GNAT family N-acetyltransferase [Paenibacillus dendritiformis]